MTHHGFAFFFQLAGTDKTRTNAAAHTLFHGNLTAHAVFLGSSCYEFQHGARTTSIDHIYTAAGKLLFQRFCHQGVSAGSAVISTENGLCTRCVECVLQCDNVCRTETADRCGTCAVYLRQGQHRRITDAAADNDNVFCIRQNGESMAERSQNVQIFAHTHIGKGICAASLGRLLKQRGLRVQNQKFDPYLNVDPGTMSPYQHGEVFVTDDGAETDLDLGHYERFTDESLTAGCSVSAGKVYWSVLCREREGGYLGRTVQIIPHITDEIKSRIYQMDNGTSDVLITEIGGTVGDIESQPFLEAIRQVAAEQGKKNVLFIHVPMIVEIPGSGELKSKPTQHSVKELLSIGIQPDILVCRTNQPMTEDICRKIALFCNMEPDCVIPNTTASTLYEVPLLLEREGLANVVCRKLELACGAPDLTAWSEMVARIKTASRHVSIALVGKYTELHDAYLSVEESLFHAGTANNVIVDINWVDSSKLTQENAEAVLGGCAGILVPGGFGDRGIEGMIVAAQYARTHKIPYFGICLGMQIAVIEFARHVLGWEDAHSAEFDEFTKHPVIDIMPEQKSITQKGGTMRLGAYPCVLSEGSRAAALYGKTEISERHRHRYEFCNDFRDAFVAAGLVPTGLSPDGRLVEIVELPDHPWFTACQFHPEFKSRPDRPHPLFFGFVEAAASRI